MPNKCCDLHGRKCEPPADLCCAECTETAHDMFDSRRGYHARDNSLCSNPDLSYGKLVSQVRAGRIEIIRADPVVAYPGPLLRLQVGIDTPILGHPGFDPATTPHVAQVTFYDQYDTPVVYDIRGWDPEPDVYTLVQPVPKSSGPTVTSSGSSPASSASLFRNSSSS